MLVGSLGIVLLMDGGAQNRSQLLRAPFQSHTKCVPLNQKTCKRLWDSFRLLADEKLVGGAPR